MATIIATLDDLSVRGSDVVGVKAANLGELKRAGFPVPDGVVLTTGAFDLYLRDRDVHPDADDAALPADVVEALTRALSLLGDGRLAVRSSGVEEDLAGASFAGQYDTVLDLRGADALAKAVQTCWASAMAPRVTGYRAAKGLTGTPRMAVLVQKLVSADAAGVAFTANPVTGDRSETIVNAVRGLGDRLVSGEVSPDEWVVRGPDVECHRSVEGAIDSNQARAIAELARRAEAHFGCPQDIEWAIEDGEIFLLQARPISALPEAITPVPVPVEVPPGFWQREIAHAPRPLSPMVRQTFLALQNSSARRWFDEFGLLMETVDFREIGGLQYVRIVPLGGKDRRPPPAWLMWILVRLVPRMRNRLNQCVAAIRTDKPGAIVERWYSEWAQSWPSTIEHLRQVDLRSLSDAALDDHVVKAARLCQDIGELKALLHGAEMTVIADLAFTCRDLLGWGDNKALDLLKGLSGTSTEPASRLAHLAQMAKGRPRVVQLLERASRVSAQELSEADPEFYDEFQRHLDRYGCRAIRYDVEDPSVAETPELLLRLLHGQIARGYDPGAAASDMERTRDAVIAEARALLQCRPPDDLERFERALARGQRAYPTREDSGALMFSCLALFRYAALELGRRLVEREQLAHQDDVFFLEADEARDALRNGEERRSLVRRRKGERAWVEAHPGPLSYGEGPGPLPSFVALPREARFAHEALMWFMDRMDALETQKANARGKADGHSWSGIGASGGRYTGPARVVMDESQFGKLEPGDVLVCPITSPIWSVVFPTVGAVVTDTGGVLCHSAIIAREYGVPAVVATGNATTRLRDGQMVTVDGTLGQVELV
jgi:phosphohistidine swiveling domain-containing protein